jgi:restriction endonuclease
VQRTVALIPWRSNLDMVNENLEANEAVNVYAKLPGWFKVPTPLGTYNPDWAVLVEIDGQEKLYFVVETKDSNWWDDLRHKEGAKIKCGEKHFSELAVGQNPAQYINDATVYRATTFLERKPPNVHVIEDTNPICVDEGRGLPRDTGYCQTI